MSDPHQLLYASETELDHPAMEKFHVCKIKMNGPMLQLYPLEAKEIEISKVGAKSATADSCFSIP